MPTSQKFHITRLGNGYVLKQGAAAEASMPEGDPLLPLDYRCNVPGGAMGTSFPPALKRCMADVAALSVEEVRARYTLPSELTARNLRQRAADLSARGYEWTLMHGAPRNPPGKSYKFLPPCCSVKWTAGKWVCAVPGWAASLNTSLPYGDPYYGLAWKKAGPDPGSYVGGTEW